MPASRMQVLGEHLVPAADARRRRRSRCRARRRARAVPGRCRPRRRARAARRTRRRALGRAAARRDRRPTSIGTTLVAERSSASSTRAPERSETWRSSERPPLSTATRLIGRAARRAAAARAPSRGSAARRPAPARRAVGRAGSAAAPARRPVSVEYSATCSRTTLPIRAHALADVVLVDAGEVQPHRRAAAAVEERGAPGTNATFSRSARASRSVVSM